MAKTLSNAFRGKSPSGMDHQQYSIARRLTFMPKCDLPASLWPFLLLLCLPFVAAWLLQQPDVQLLVLQHPCAPEMPCQWLLNNTYVEA